MKEVAEKIKKYFKTLLNEDVVVKECVIIYYDGKTLQQFHDQIKCSKKRISVIADSPHLPSEQVLAVPFTPSNSGKDQMKVVMKVLQEWGIEPNIMGLGFDTTSDNTGIVQGISQAY